MDYYSLRERERDRERERERERERDERERERERARGEEREEREREREREERREERRERERRGRERERERRETLNKHGFNCTPSFQLVDLITFIFWRCGIGYICQMGMLEPIPTSQAKGRKTLWMDVNASLILTLWTRFSKLWKVLQSFHFNLHSMILSNTQQKQWPRQ